VAEIGRKGGGQSYDMGEKKQKLGVEGGDRKAGGRVKVNYSTSHSERIFPQEILGGNSSWKEKVKEITGNRGRGG